jgi:hypothetical protein
MTLGSDREVASESFVLSSLPGNKSIVEAYIASATSQVHCCSCISSCVVCKSCYLSKEVLACIA